MAISEVSKYVDFKVKNFDGTTRQFRVHKDKALKEVKELYEKVLKLEIIGFGIFLANE